MATKKKIYKEFDLTEVRDKKLHEIFDICVRGNWDRVIDEFGFEFLKTEDHSKRFCRVVIKGFATEKVWNDFYEKLIREEEE